MDSACKNICGSYEWSPRDPTEETDEMTDHLLPLPPPGLLTDLMSNVAMLAEMKTVHGLNNMNLYLIKASWQLKNKKKTAKS